MSKSQGWFWKQECKEWLQRPILKSMSGGAFKKELRNERWEQNDRGRTLRTRFHSSRQLGGEVAERIEQKCAHHRLWRKPRRLWANRFCLLVLHTRKPSYQFRKVSPKLTCQDLLPFHQAMLPGDETKGSVEHWGANTDSREEVPLWDRCRRFSFGFTSWLRKVGEDTGPHSNGQNNSYTPKMSTS